MAGRSRASVDADVRPNRRRAFPASLVECRWRDGNRILHNHGHGTRHPSYSFRRRRCRAVHDRVGYTPHGSHPPDFFRGSLAVTNAAPGPPTAAPSPPLLPLHDETTTLPPSPRGIHT